MRVIALSTLLELVDRKCAEQYRIIILKTQAMRGILMGKKR